MQFRVQYYIFALIFLVFDVETVFLFPWAVAFDQLPMFAVLEGILFILILVAGLVYAWRKGALEMDVVASEYLHKRLMEFSSAFSVFGLNISFQERSDV